MKEILEKYKNQLQCFSYKLEGRFMYIQNIIIKEKNKGYGTKIMKEILLYAKKNNIKVSLHAIPVKQRTKKQNKLIKKRLYNFYKSLGMTQEMDSLFTY